MFWFGAVGVQFAVFLRCLWFEHPFLVTICVLGRSYMLDLCLFVFFLADDLVFPVSQCLNHR